jgi:hypothetical protein
MWQVNAILNIFATCVLRFPTVPGGLLYVRTLCLPRTVTCRFEEAIWPSQNPEKANGATAPKEQRRIVKDCPSRSGKRSNILEEEYESWLPVVIDARAQSSDLLTLRAPATNHRSRKNPNFATAK